jgi:gamma-glutamylcyclotransferase (GGCT)/AIG2-like uncharacterized protein YtfP
MVESSVQGEAVEGELWEVDERALRILDALEGVPHIFNRKTIQTEGGDAQAFLMDKPLFARRIGKRCPNTSIMGRLRMWPRGTNLAKSEANC